MRQYFEFIKRGLQRAPDGRVLPSRVPARPRREGRRQGAHRPQGRLQPALLLLERALLARHRPRRQGHLEGDPQEQGRPAHQEPFGQRTAPRARREGRRGLRAQADRHHAEVEDRAGRCRRRGDDSNEGRVLAPERQWLSRRRRVRSGQSASARAVRPHADARDALPRSGRHHSEGQRARWKTRAAGA